MGGSGDPKIGIALGAGSARGLAHISFIEAMDELGLVPHRISGSSIGALVGAGWAMGISGRDMREQAFDMLGSMNAMFGRLFSHHLPSLKHVMRQGLSLQLDAERTFDAFTPAGMPTQFSDLKIPFYSVATDFKTWHQLVFHTGPLRTAVAGSLAVPSVFTPVTYRDTLLVDGGVVNPLPLDTVQHDTDILIGIDVNGDPHDWKAEHSPSALDVAVGAAQIMMHRLIAHTMAAYPPDLYFRPNLHAYGAYEYWRVKEIVAAADTDKERFKRQLSRKIEMFKT